MDGRWDTVDFPPLKHLDIKYLIVMGKAEGSDKLWHGHVTALTVSPDFRRMGIAKRLMDHLEEVSEKMCVISLYVII